MRKIKKINGYLVVKFNDREKRDNEGTGLGEYGVIDAELYTGHLDIDRGEMEYDGAGTLEEAVELARGLESEMDITEQPPTYTVSTETDEGYTEEEVDPPEVPPVHAFSVSEPHEVRPVVRRDPLGVFVNF